MCRVLFIAFAVGSFFFSGRGFSQEIYTIPVVDLRDFFNSETKQSFVDKVAQAMHEVGFFAVINTGSDEKVLKQAYKASEEFFSRPLEEKLYIFDASLNGQRGYVLSEIAQGYTQKDFKEFLHVGRSGNLWPYFMDLQHPLDALRLALDAQGRILERAFALAIGEQEDYFTKMTESGECLLRALHYPANPTEGSVWAAQHTDIDLFTMLPVATEEGLQVFYQGQWVDVKVPEDAFIINVGDKLQNLTNGYFKSSLHRVVAKPHVERYSIVYFVHPRDDDSMEPTSHCIQMTGGVQRYPQASSLELLASRLRELGLASPELLLLEKESRIMDRVKKLVEDGVAAEPVERTYRLWETSHKD